MPRNKLKVYLSLDVETDGQTPGLNNLLTMGVVAFSEEGNYLDSFYERIIPLPDLKPMPETMIWWRTQDNFAYYEAFDANPPGVIVNSASKERVCAFDAMLNFAAWLNHIKISLDTKEVGFTPLAWPAAFDHAFISYYSHRFLGKGLLGYDCLDIRSYIMGLLREQGYYDVSEADITNLFGKYDRGNLRPHNALDDARAQGELFFHIRNSPMASKALIMSGT